MYGAPFGMILYAPAHVFLKVRRVPLYSIVRGLLPPTIVGGCVGMILGPAFAWIGALAGYFIGVRRFERSGFAN